MTIVIYRALISGATQTQQAIKLPLELFGSYFGFAAADMCLLVLPQYVPQKEDILLKFGIGLANNNSSNP